MFVNKDILNKIKSAVRIQSIAEEWTNLKKSKKNLVGLCPIHSEKTASFFVNPQNQTFKCFGCGKGGDVIALVMAKGKLTFYQAITQLAAIANIEIPKPHNANLQEKEAQTLFFATQHYKITLQNNPEALTYLQKRNIYLKDIDNFDLGYDDGTLIPTAEKLKLDISLFVKHKLHENHFRNRITFPIINIHNETIAFGARNTTDKHPKYINSSNSNVFNKSRNYYNNPNFLDTAKEEKAITITEGYLDAIAAWQQGYHNTLSINGTALSKETIHNISTITDKVVLALDNDTAGQQATSDAITQLLQANLQVHILDLGNYNDLHEAINNNHKPQPLTIAEYHVNRLTPDKTTISEAINNIKKTLGIIPNKTYRQEIINTIANAIQIPSNIISN